MKNAAKVLACTLSAVLVGTVFSGCGQSNGTTTGSTSGVPSKQVTLKVMLDGTKPNGWDAVEAEFEKETQKTLNTKLDVNWVDPGNYKDKLNLTMTAKEDYDLVYDAPWLDIKTIAPNGGYADLGKYFNNSAYPGLKKSFDTTVVKNNKLYGKNYSLPILRTYGTGIQVVYYRQDLATKYGISSISSYADFQKYLDAIKSGEPSMTPLTVKNTRGFYQMTLTDDDTYSDANLLKDNIVTVSPGNDIFFEAQLNSDRTAVKNIVAVGDPDSKYSVLPAPFNTNWWAEKYARYKDWNKYLEKDSLNQKDDTTQFVSGKAGALIGTLDDYDTVNTKFSANLPNGQIGEFYYNPDTRAKKKGAVITNYQANNLLCVPATSKKIDYTMKFLDWLYSSQDNHDLFELGIQGKNWEAVGKDQYKLPSGVTAQNNYNFPGYVMTWNNNYVRFSNTLPDSVLSYKKYELQDSTFTANPLGGFSFDTSSVKTQLAQVNALHQNIVTPLAHGVLADPVGTFEKTTAQERQNGLNDIEKAIVSQINTYLSQNAKGGSSTSSK